MVQAESAAPSPGNLLVGRGNRDGAQLFRDWFDSLGAARDAGKGGAYVFVMGSLAELLRTFDFPSSSPRSTRYRRRFATPRTSI